MIKRIFEYQFQFLSLLIHNDYRFSFFNRITALLSCPKINSVILNVYVPTFY